MMTNKHIVVIDAITFAGGSKVATNTILTTIAVPAQRITIITSDPASWDKKFHIIKLWQPSWLAVKEQGVLYFLRHLIIALHVLFVHIWHGKINVAIGASSPGVDLSLYLAGKIINYRIIQLVHGPVSCSGTIARCLITADSVFYLASSFDSLTQCMTKKLGKKNTEHLLRGNRFKPFINGIAKSAWPSQCQYHTPKLLWAASLLKWKGLDFFINTISSMPLAMRPLTHICFIRPKKTAQAVSEAFLVKPKVYWHQQPTDLNTIRASCNIFVSTSQNEPFGLSILEALSAGLCVIIPKDNAYWDQTLCHGVNCIKYQTNDLNDLVEKILSLSGNLQSIRKIGQSGKQLSTYYQASHTYREINNMVMQ
ncbi:MAG: glycosyltransferase family 4 protein [Psychrobium sp.]|nr:glycosyltransferase family 4 protein [Psychrobium sp.]